jgi:hypothetical protein
MTLDVEQIAARWVLGQLTGREAAEAAVQALLEGHDGPALREVAGTVNPVVRDVAPAFERALDELRATRVSRKQAALFLAKRYAARILDGSVSPYSGARSIWQELSLEVRPDDHTLDPFIYWADEYESAHDPERQKQCELAIVDSARTLVAT